MTRCSPALLALLAFAAPAFAQADRPKEPKSEDPQPRREERPGNGRFGGSGGDRMQGIMNVLTLELDLDTDQQVKVKKILDESMRDIMRNMGRFWGGDPNSEGFADARKAFDDMRVKMAGKISKVLTRAQRKEFDLLVDNFDRRAQSFEQNRRAQEDPSELLNPRPISKRILMGKAERALFLGPEETAVVMPFIEKVIDTRHALYEGRKVRRKDLLNAISGGAKEDEVRQRMEDIRAAEQFQHLELIAGQQALRELLTIEQEVRFVALELLD